MAATLTGLSAVVPSILLIWYFRSRDLYPEPARVLAATFGLGVLIVLPVLIVALPVDRALVGVGSPYVSGLLGAFLTAAIPEEAFKLLVVTRYCSRHREFDEPIDGIVYGAVASLGFATLENVLYVARGGLPLAAARALTAVPGHAFMGAIMGYYVARAKFEPEKRRSSLALAFLVPMLVHGAYDFPLLTLKALNGGATNGEALGLIAFALVVLVFAGRRAIRLARSARLAQTLDGPPSPVLEIAKPSAPVSVAVAAALPRSNASRAVAWIELLAGAALASVGALMTLGAALNLRDPQKVASIVVGWVVVGLLPALLGIFLFRRGIHRQNRASGTAGD